MIRMLEDGDQATWQSLWIAYVSFDGSTLPDAVHERTWARLMDATEPMHGALAFVDGEAVGFVHYLFHRSTWSISDACYLQDLFVLPSVRGTGCGRALIEHVAAAAAVAGSSRVYWQTQHDNVPAIALYEKVGQRSPYIQFRKDVAPVS